MVGAETPDSPGCIAGTVYTAGFSNLPLHSFLANLRAHGIQVLVDVRSKPYASYTPHYNKDQIEAAAKADGLRYLYLGQDLGGRPDNPGFYDDENVAVVEMVATQAAGEEEEEEEEGAEGAESGACVPFALTSQSLTQWS